RSANRLAIRAAPRASHSSSPLRSSCGAVAVRPPSAPHPARVGARLRRPPSPVERSYARTMASLRPPHLCAALLLAAACGDDAAFDQTVVELAIRDDDGVIVALWAQGDFAIGGETFSSPDDTNVAVVSIAADGTIEGFIPIAADGPSPTITGLVPLPAGGVAV